MRQEILDHGYVELIESWGSDERIIEAARMSTNKGFQGWGGMRCTCCSPTLEMPDPDCEICKGVGKTTGDEKLLKYLWDHKHHTPFEMGGLIIEVQAPIFVFREWHRHRTQSYNELSARYTPLPDLNYVPSTDRCLAATGQNKQSAPQFSNTELSVSDVETWLVTLRQAYAHCQQVYEKGLKLGIPKELARLPVNVARYSRMRASANLRNWLGFLALRCEPHAQWEIRQYAKAVLILVASKFPRTCELFKDSLKFFVE